MDGLIRKVEVKTTIPDPRTSIDKNLKTVHRIKAINHLIPLELKVEVNEHSLDPSLDANLSQNMENPILEAQAPTSIHTDDTRNLENPHPADIRQRLEFNVRPDTGEAVVYLIVRGQNQLNIKMLNWYSAPIIIVRHGVTTFAPIYRTKRPSHRNNHSFAHSVLPEKPPSGVTIIY